MLVEFTIRNDACSYLFNIPIINGVVITDLRQLICYIVSSQLMQAAVPYLTLGDPLRMILATAEKGFAHQQIGDLSQVLGALSAYLSVRFDP